LWSCGNKFPQTNALKRERERESEREKEFSLATEPCSCHATNHFIADATVFGKKQSCQIRIIKNENKTFETCE
jgi:hypothetical protein